MCWDCDPVWGVGLEGRLIKFSLSKNDKQMWWFTGLVALWHLCGFWEGNRIVRKTQWVSWVPRGLRAKKVEGSMSFMSLQGHQTPPLGDGYRNQASKSLGTKGPLSAVPYGSLWLHRACGLSGSHLGASWWEKAGLEGHLYKTGVHGYCELSCVMV